MARKDGRDRGIVEKPAGSGVWWVRLYRDRKEHWHRCDSKSQARAVYGKLKGKIREDQYFPKPKRREPIPFETIAESYEQAVDADRRRKGDDRAQVQYWIDLFGRRDIESITTAEIEAALIQLRQPLKERSGRLKKGGRRSYETMRAYFGVVHAIFERGRRRLKAENVSWMNPASDIELKRADNTLIRRLDPEQEAALFRALPTRYHPIVKTALHTGARKGELLRLTWGDIDWYAGMAKIGEAKNGEPRYAALNSLVQRILIELKEQTNPQPSDRIFPFYPRYLSRAFQRAVVKAKIAPFRFHDCRHHFASKLAQLGANDRTIMEAGGWKSPAMLRRYVHLGPSAVWRAVEQLAHQADPESQPLDKQKEIAPSKATS